ncbi:hypothetical protein Mgra_00009955 [Meloidogyne graminicola]|uniref:NADH dehydrogenase [ubiquinone] 1 beta subcomplex subunit 5, mitochondrial n=1 Tax=Meloidogyne graminicola TaxID=189291 RepID=A0A8S9Z8R8_9BILA|nr:hypothetical protein Mgra_00009955 [Meloidogyne graminicola]
MPAISKFYSPSIYHQLVPYRYDLFNFLFVENGRQAVNNVIVRHSAHSWIFKRRQGQLINNRVKDAMHFYVIGIGLIPGAILLFITSIIFGSQCELAEYPKEGEQPPHYWQFERTPLRQFIAKYLSTSDMQYHESWASRFSHWQIKNRWNRIEARVKHLIGERQDYKAYHYHPVTNEWVEVAKRRAALFEHHYFPRACATTRMH